MPMITPAEASEKNKKICALAPVIPVLLIDDAKDAKDLGQALLKGGLPALEVTLRTPAALDSIAAMAEIEGAVVGAGTLLNETDVKDAIAAGAQFGVSPGATDNLLDACERHGLPLLAGASSASEVMALLQRGYRVAKFFPAQPAGGAEFIAALASPLPQMQFCPTGGISAQNAADYLSLPNVLCVGGSWVAPKAALQARDWDQVTALAAAASNC